MAEFGRGKRRRTIASYAEQEQKLDDLILSLEHPENRTQQESEKEIEEDDLNYGEINFANKNKKRRKTLKKPKPKKEPPAFPFLKLPPELRDEIYRYLLTDTMVDVECKMKKQHRVACRDMDPILIDSETNLEMSAKTQAALTRFSTEHDKIKYVRRVRFFPSILATCKQIQGETTGLLYGQRLRMQDSRTLHVFLVGIGPSNRKHIRDITLARCGKYTECHRTMTYPAFTLLASCTNIKSVSFGCSVSARAWCHVYRVASILYRDCYDFLLTLANAKGGDIDAALDLIHLSPCNFDKSYHGNGWFSGNDDKKLSAEELAETKSKFRTILKGFTSTMPVVASQNKEE